jgi:L-ribulokinase
MQVYSDVLRLPISTIASDQGPALGSAIHAAVAAGIYPDVRAAGDAMGKVNRNVYQPNEEAALAYDRLYAEYSELHDYFGRGSNDVMHRLRAIRRDAFANGGRASGTPDSMGPDSMGADDTEQESFS